MQGRRQVVFVWSFAFLFFQSTFLLLFLFLHFCFSSPHFSFFSFFLFSFPVHIFVVVIVFVFFLFFPVHILLVFFRKCSVLYIYPCVLQAGPWVCCQRILFSQGTHESDGVQNLQSELPNLLLYFFMKKKKKVDRLHSETRSKHEKVRKEHLF